MQAGAGSAFLIAALSVLSSRHIMQYSMLQAANYPEWHSFSIANRESKQNILMHRAEGRTGTAHIMRSQVSRDPQLDKFSFDPNPCHDLTYHAKLQPILVV
jgi:hypothetical protein